MCVYVYMCMYVCMYVCMYIYIYIYIGHRDPFTRPGTGRSSSEGRAFRSRNLVDGALMGSLQMFMFFDRDFSGTPVNLLLYSQKCQGVPFSPICQIHYFCSSPISVDPICPQPTRCAQELETEMVVMQRNAQAE